MLSTTMDARRVVYATCGVLVVLSSVLASDEGVKQRRSAELANSLDLEEDLRRVKRIQTDTLADSLSRVKRVEPEPVEESLSRVKRIDPADQLQRMKRVRRDLTRVKDAMVEVQRKRRQARMDNSVKVLHRQKRIGRRYRKKRTDRQHMKQMKQKHMRKTHNTEE